MSLKSASHIVRVSSVVASIITEEQVDIVGHHSLASVVNLTLRSSTPAQMSSSSPDLSKEVNAFVAGANVHFSCRVATLLAAVSYLFHPRLMKLNHALFLIDERR